MELHQRNTCKVLTVYRSVFDSERNFAFNKSVADTRSVKPKGIIWCKGQISFLTLLQQAGTERGRQHDRNSAAAGVTVPVGAAGQPQFVLPSHSPMHRTCGALSLWERNMWGRPCNAALHPHESRNMIRLFHIANSRCVTIEMTTLFMQETSYAVR